MFLDPNKLSESSPTEILEAAAQGHIGLDQRFLRALLDRRDEALPEVIQFAAKDRSDYVVDLEPELIALIRAWRAPEGLPFLIDYIRDEPSELPDEIIETIVEIGEPALEPLLALYNETDESGCSEIAFILASLGVRDRRIFDLLLEYAEYDLSDGAFLLSVYGDLQAKPFLEQKLASLTESEREAAEQVKYALQALSEERPASELEPYDIFEGYLEQMDLPIDLLDEDERADLLNHALPHVRATAAASFFNRELSPELRNALLPRAQNDESDEVRARAWEALTTAVEETEVLDAMLAALRRADLSPVERSGLLVGLSPEADRNEVRKAILEEYKSPETRAKALEAMWRSMHPGFREYFARHLEDSDRETRRSAVWGVGYYGLKGELDRIRNLFDDEELRSDALFAYALALPGEVSRGRMKGLLTRIEKDAKGLSELEEDLVKAALDERLMIAGKEPFFMPQSD
ncbi:MAG TPA: HEAT repeat domain-containing protein [Bryobacteraceae bacterium]|nr:HEAT repeat domain-containing protein [Bryobacteraceae bacterium]